MTTVADILQFMESVAPAAMKMEWDTVGLLCGDRNAPVTKILVALDPFEAVCREAMDREADLLITHHPLIFQPISAVTEDTEVGRCVRMLTRKGISAINAHTNYDCAPGGVNDVLAQTLGLSDIQVIKPMGVDDRGRPYGLLRSGFVPEQDMDAFLPHVKDALGCKGLRYFDCGRPVRKVAVGGGTCGDEMGDAADAGCDTFVTADIKYHQFHDALVRGLNLIDAGHYHTEFPACRVLAQKLAAAFPEISVLLSENPGDLSNFF